MVSGSNDKYRAETYQTLTESVDPRNSSFNTKWTVCLVLCCLSACTASFQFGYNIGSTNLPGQLIKNFFTSMLYPNEVANDYLEKKAAYNILADFIVLNNKSSQLNETNIVDKAFLEFLKNQTERYNILESVNITESITNALFERVENENITYQEIKKEKENLLKNIEEMIKFYWTILNCCFVVGGMLGAFSTKLILDFMGRKKGIIFHNLFTIIASVLVYYAVYFKNPYFVMVSRFLFGVQGGMMCGLIPTYLNEISPKSLRGATGVLSQLFITTGILVAQTLGFRELLGTSDKWNILLALPIIPSILGVLSLMFFFPDSPKALLLDNDDETACRKALKKLRNTTNVTYEIEEMLNEHNESKSDEAISICRLFTSSELRWPLITGLVLNLTQQLCGINAIFFYSGSIFAEAKIQKEHIQYAVFATGLINVISTIIVVPLIDKLGRKPLLVYPMALIIVDFIVLTVCLRLKDQSITFSYLSIVCIIVFIMCFAVGLGPIPFIYVAECFGQESRSAALAVCMFGNWLANLFLTLAFPYMKDILTDWTFVVFLVIVVFALLIITTKVPETKGRNVEEIMEYFNGKSKTKYQKSRDIQLEVKA